MALGTFSQILLAAGSTISLENNPIGQRADHSRLLGTNIALWHDPSALEHASLRDLVKQWAPGLVRLPGGSWSNAYFWNGNGVRNGPDSLNAGAFQEDEWQIDYTAYQPGFRIGTSLSEPSDYHGAMDVAYQHAFATSLDAPQMVTVNAGTGRPLDAVEWLKWAQRKQYPVAYWEIGNELNGQWEHGHFLGDGRRMTGPIYAERYLDFVRALKAVSPDIKTGGPASSDLSLAFVEDLLRIAGPEVDFISFHAYPVAVDDTSLRGMLHALDALRVAVARIRAWIVQYQPARKDLIEIGVTEWHMKVNEDRYSSDLRNGLWSAAWIGTLLESGVTFANQWDLLTRGARGGHGAFYYEDREIIPKSHYWAHYIWSKLMGPQPIRCEASVPDPLVVFATRSAEALTLMLINLDPEKEATVAITPPLREIKGTHYTIHTFSEREYFWDPFRARPLWSHPPAPSSHPLENLLQHSIAPASIQVIELSLEKPSQGPSVNPLANATVDATTALRLIGPDDPPSDLPVECFLVAWSGDRNRPAQQHPLSVRLKGSGSFDGLERDLVLDGPVTAFSVVANREGPGSLIVEAGPLYASLELSVQRVQEHRHIVWTFDAPRPQWYVETSYTVEREISAKPNEWVAGCRLEAALPTPQNDTVLGLTSIPESVQKAEIGGVFGDLMSASFPHPIPPDAAISVVLQSSDNHWMPIGRLPLAKIPTGWTHFEFSIDHPRLLAAMTGLYSLRFQLESETPLTGDIYLDNIGFILRRQISAP